jgi:hypothetical protein
MVDISHLFRLLTFLLGILVATVKVLAKQSVMTHILIGLGSLLFAGSVYGEFM